MHKMMLPPSGPSKGRVIVACNYELKEMKGRGRGLYLTEDVKAGDTILLEEPAVIGPKQMSPLVCVECLIDLPTIDDYVPCAKCGMIFCIVCYQNNSLKSLHEKECALFEEAHHKFQIKSCGDARKMNLVLAPLRFLLASETDPSLFDLEGNHENRIDTLLYHVAQVNVVENLCQMLPKGRFTPEMIHRACGALETNCYELGWEGVCARAIYREISYINHSCIPNARKHVDSERRMTVVAARDIASGEEVLVSYTASLFATPARQVILQQTKHFTCECRRCMDPTELGMNLAAMRCPKCKSGDVLPLNPRDMKTNFECQECHEVVEAEMVKMILDTSMKFIGRGSRKTRTGTETEDILNYLERFLKPSHYLIQDLKLKYLGQKTKTLKNDDIKGVALAKKYCQDLLKISKAINPGQSKLQGQLSNSYHLLEDIEPGPNKMVPSDLVLSRTEVASMFSSDAAFLSEFVIAR